MTNSVRTATEISHGICVRCVQNEDLAPVERLAELTEKQADMLPYGLIELNVTGHVRLYNAAESQLANRSKAQVVGRHFFTEVAPCTHLQELEAKFNALVRQNEMGRRELDFVFAFDTGEVHVHIVLCYDADTRKTTLLIQPLDGRNWDREHLH